MGSVSDLLLDTHALLWWLLDDAQLSAPARAAIAEPGNRIWVSAASGWEVATKHRIGKLPEAAEIAERFSYYLRRARFIELPISIEHSLKAGALPGPHRDPFDRMLIAQHFVTRYPVVTRDAVFRDYGVAIVW